MRFLPSLAAAALLAGAALAADTVKVGFDDMEAGKPPAGFSFGRTGAGAPGAWEVRDGALAQTSTDRTDYRYPVALFDGGAWKDLAASVRFEALSGEVDEAAGIVFRAKGPRDYYVVRANALESDVCLYRVAGGIRSQLARKEVPVTAKAWHALGVVAAGDRFEVSLDGTRLFEQRDQSFDAAGKVGLWTKSDSVTLFDDLTIEPR